MSITRYYSILLFPLLFFLTPLKSYGQQDQGINGDWKLSKNQSTEISLYNTLSLNIKSSDDSVRIIQIWGTHRSTIDTLELKTGGSVNEIPVESRVWPTNVFMGVSQIPGSHKKVAAKWSNGHQQLDITEQYEVWSSQGKALVKSDYTYALSKDGQSLTITIDRSTRKTGKPLRYVFHRPGTKKAYYVKLNDNWELNGGLPINAFLISLQGLANFNGPNLYFIYPNDWTYTFTPSVMKFYEKRYHYDFEKLANASQAFAKFHDAIKGYVVWDPSVRTSLNVAFTVAGLDTAVVITPNMIPAMKQAGIPKVADFSGRFEGKTDAQIYKWAYQKYGKQCSRKFIVWMGGVSGNKMQPGIADFGIYKHAFFTDLSTLEKDTTEYNLAGDIMSRQKPYTMVMGWHSYAKDKERDFVKLASHYALRVEGLNTLPNMSFTSQIPPTPGFKFKNHHNIVPGKKYKPKKKVYIACIQTDGLGLGAWLKPGRGEIPYAWEVTMNWKWLAPAMLEYFYSQATPNDYFIGSLSGPGYMYPKAIPPKYLPGVIKRADTLMHKLDLNVFEIMDYSQGATIEGNTELPKRIVKAYYKYMPNAIGFVNGYAPAHTFYVQNGRPFISFDYYLSPKRPAKEVVSDLEELASINSKRPYFLLMHVREWSDIKHVKEILDQLGPDFKVVPLDVFMKLAGNAPTYKDHFMQKTK